MVTDWKILIEKRRRGTTAEVLGGEVPRPQAGDGKHAEAPDGARRTSDRGDTGEKSDILQPSRSIHPAASVRAGFGDREK